MPQQVRGVIARSKGAPVEVTTIVIPDPGPGEVVVNIQACGVCHTDLTYREGGINDEYPFLLGHEAAGIVEEVGPGVDSVAVGDFVILNWRAVCGQCRACKRGRPQYCFDTFNATQKMTLEDGTELTPALGIGAFADKTLVHAGQCTKVDASADPAVVGLLGCGVMAGLGAAARCLRLALPFLLLPHVLLSIPHREGVDPSLGERRQQLIRLLLFLERQLEQLHDVIMLHATCELGCAAVGRDLIVLDTLGRRDDPGIEYFRIDVFLEQFLPFLEQPFHSLALHPALFETYVRVSHASTRRVDRLRPTAAGTREHSAHRRHIW